jgi:hypothetical protein
MAAAGTLDVDAVKAALSPLVAEDDERLTRLDDAVQRAAEAAP